MLVRFDDVVGHERPIRALRRAWAGGRLHHAYLASGPEGVGKRAVAWALAALVNCEAPVGEGESSDALLIIVLAVAVLGVLILAYCARLLYVHVNIEKFKLEAAKQ